MEIKMVFLAILCHIVVITLGHKMENDLSNDFKQCLESTGNSSKSTINDIIHCVQQFMWQTGSVKWSQFNITNKGKQFINSLIGTVHERKKRQVDANGRQSNSTQHGLRIRREYRLLTDRERFDFHSAINIMKVSGQYDTFANLHRGMFVYSAHGGPNFLGWHRVFLALFEEALRRINPTLSLPYWDSTLDFDMINPVNSILWSSSFLGNGDGFVTSGPFANWNTSVGRLTRNIGIASRLFSKESIRSIMIPCRTRDISEPTAQLEFSLEFLHGGPHVWVGGQMSGLNTAAYDPAFFLHHAFVDFIWETFRTRQQRYCGVDPSTDYPNVIGQHAAERPMDSMPSYRNLDGYSSYWTRFVYGYATIPNCSSLRPFCGSPYLRCDAARQRCVSIARTGSIDGAVTDLASVTRARAEESTINIGPRFRAPPSDFRTQDAQLNMARSGDVVSSLIGGVSTGTNFARARVEESTINIGLRFNAPPSEIRTQDAQLRLPRSLFVGSNMVFPSSLTSALRARAQEATINIGPRFAAPPPDPRTQDARFGLFRRRF